mgnify:CR=1 FL=1
MKQNLIIKIICLSIITILSVVVLLNSLKIKNKLIMYLMICTIVVSIGYLTYSLINSKDKDRKSIDIHIDEVLDNFKSLPPEEHKKKHKKLVSKAAENHPEKEQMKKTIAETYNNILDVFIAKEKLHEDGNGDPGPRVNDPTSESSTNTDNLHTDKGNLKKKHYPRQYPRFTTNDDESVNDGYMIAVNMGLNLSTLNKQSTSINDFIKTITKLGGLDPTGTALYEQTGSKHHEIIKKLIRQKLCKVNYPEYNYEDVESESLKLNGHKPTDQEKIHAKKYIEYLKTMKNEIKDFKKKYGKTQLYWLTPVLSRPLSAYIMKMMYEEPINKTICDTYGVKEK